MPDALLIKRGYLAHNTSWNLAALLLRGLVFLPKNIKTIGFVIEFCWSIKKGKDLRRMQKIGHDEGWKMASVKNTPVLGERSIRQVQYSSRKSHPTVV